MTTELDRRMRYISDFAADVAHEFKSPLTSIRGAAELLSEGAADDPVARARFLRNIELDVGRLDRLVTRLLELSRIEASGEAKTEFDLHQLLRRICERAGTPDTAVTLSGLDGPCPVRARLDDLETALSNLCDNGVRFSPPGGTVSVEVVPGRDLVEISVVDDGPGVPEAHRARVFQRFFTTDADKDGTGLGLAIASAVATSHGGGLTLAPARDGEGARFVLRLPRALDPTRSRRG